MNTNPTAIQKKLQCVAACFLWAYKVIRPESTEPEHLYKDAYNIYCNRNWTNRLISFLKERSEEELVILFQHENNIYSTLLIKTVVSLLNN